MSNNIKNLEKKNAFYSNVNASLNDNLSYTSFSDLASEHKITVKNNLKKCDKKNDFLRNVNYENSCTLGFDLLRNENQMGTEADFFKSYTQNHQNVTYNTKFIFKL